MSDIKLQFDTNALDFDINFVGDDVEIDTTLTTAVFVSLFTDRRASTDDILPHEDSTLRGWWGDNTDIDEIGSKLWLLNREKITNETLNRARELCEEALAWLVEDGIASEVDVLTETKKPDILAIRARITRPNGEIQEVAFNDVWEDL